MVQGYCLKEKKKVDIKEPSFELNKKNRPIVRGKCTSCGGVVYKILASEEVPADLKAKVAAIKAKKGGKSRRSRKSTDKKSKGSRKSKKSRKSKGSRKSRSSRKSRK